MTTLFLRTLKDRWLTIAIYSVASIAFLWLYVSLFPAIRDQSAQLVELVKAYPPEFLKAFGITDITQSFSSLGNFLSTEMYSFVVPIMLAALAIGFASSAIAGEIERGTIEFLLAQPLSRTALFFGKYAAGVVAMAVFAVASTLTPIPLAAAYHLSLSAAPFVHFAVITFLFGLAILSLAFLVSAIVSDKSKVSLSVSGIVILMYVLNVVAALKDSLDKLKYVSFFHYYSPTTVFAPGATTDWKAIGVFVGVSIVATALGAWWFGRRDIATA